MREQGRQEPSYRKDCDRATSDGPQVAFAAGPERADEGGTGGAGAAFSEERVERVRLERAAGLRDGGFDAAGGGAAGQVAAGDGGGRRQLAEE